MARADGQRRIEVSISPKYYLRLDHALQLRDSFDLQLEDMTFEIFVDGQRRAVMYVGRPDAEAGERQLVDFSASAEAVEAQVRRILPAGWAELEGVPANSTPELRVGLFRGQIAAGNASALNDNDSILLVDPVTDLKDAFKDEAFQVKVSEMPNLLERMRLLGGGVYRTE